MPAPKKLEPVALALAVGAAVLAGATDVTGLSRLKDVFVSFMSGNTTLLGMAIGHGDAPRAGLIAGVIALFVAGAAGGALLSELSGRFHAAAVMGAVTLLLAVPLVRNGWTVPALILAMGALNGTMSKVGATSVGLTYVTGALVKFGAGVGRLIAGKREPRDWLLQGILWLSLLGGAVADAVLRTHGIDEWPLPLLAALLLPLCVAQAEAPKQPEA